MHAIIHTNAGDVTVDLFPNHAPKTVRNFAGLATGTQAWTDPRTGEEKTTPLYDGTIFHRIIPNFMVQAGDPLGSGRGGPGYTFDDEIHPELTFSAPYVLAMANAGRDPRTGGGTNGSQFFVTTVPTPWLQGKHTIFGQVTDEESKKIVDAIQATPTGPGDRPREDVVINSIEIVDGE